MTDYAPLPGSRNRTGRRQLTPQQQAMADELHMRAAALRAASEDGLSISEAVELAAVQLGLQSPDLDDEETGDRS